MAQYARPDNDDTVNQWSASEGEDLYACIDEATADDEDYIYSDTGVQGNSCYIGLSTVTDPESGSGHVCRWRWQSLRQSTPPEKLSIYLREGATVRATLADNVALPTSWEGDDYTLTSEEADAITDYSDLNVQFKCEVAGGGEQCQVSWFELEVPDAPGAAGISNLMLLGVG